MGIHTVRSALVLCVAGAFAACHHVEATHNLCGGTTECAKDPCSPVDVINGRPNRPFRALGVIQVRVDRGTGLQNPTLRDAIPALENEARSMGADAVILTFEEFSNWYDKGELASPIHDLERQESWYVTEKARYLSGLAVVYTGPAEPCRAGMSMSMPGAPMPAPMPGPQVAPGPRPMPAPAPSTVPYTPPQPQPAPAPSPSLPPGEIDLPRGADPAPAEQPAPPEQPAPAPAPDPWPAPAPEEPKPPTPSSSSLPPPRHIPAPIQTATK
jgi:hypothetical protein